MECSIECACKSVVALREAWVKMHENAFFTNGMVDGVFKNLMVYRLGQPWSMTQAQLEEALQADMFVDCGASQEKSVGWTAPRGQAHAALVEVVGGQWMMRLMVEVKTVPGSVVQRKVQESCAQIESTTGRKPGKKEMRDLRDNARLALLPMAFSKQSSVRVWVDVQAGLLLLDVASQSRADEVLTALVKAIPGFAVHLLDTQVSPAAAMAQWLSAREAPSGFSIDRECELKAADESKAVVRYTRHPLDTEEISQHIAQGKMPTRLAMTWADRVSFVLTEALQLKKIAFLDTVMEADTRAAGDGKDDDFDADVALSTGELSQLLPDVLDALGGEAAPSFAPSTPAQAATV